MWPLTSKKNTAPQQRLRPAIREKVGDSICSHPQSWLLRSVLPMNHGPYILPGRTVMRRARSCFGHLSRQFYSKFPCKSTPSASFVLLFCLKSYFFNAWFCWKSWNFHWESVIILPIIMISSVSLNILIQGSKGHAFHASMKKHDLLTRKTPKSSHFS